MPRYQLVLSPLYSFHNSQHKWFSSNRLRQSYAGSTTTSKTIAISPSQFRS
jgi:hypothetical protein